METNSLNAGQINKFVEVFKLKDLHKNDKKEWVAYDDIDGELIPVVITPEKYWAAWDEGDLV